MVSSFTEKVVLNFSLSVVNYFYFPLVNIVISKAQNWGFMCQRQESNCWQILPQQRASRWKLQQVQDRWILSVGDVPQLSLHTEETVLFLEGRRLENN